MPIVRALVLGSFLCLVTSAPLLAVTPEELAALAKAGLGDEVLLALIDSTGVDRRVDATGALALKKGGVSDRVIAAAVRVSNDTPLAAPAAMAPPVACSECDNNIAVIGDTPPAQVVGTEVIYVPWIWPAPRRHHGVAAQPYFAGDRKFGRFINDGFVEPTKSRR